MKNFISKHAANPATEDIGGTSAAVPLTVSTKTAESFVNPQKHTDNDGGGSVEGTNVSPDDRTIDQLFGNGTQQGANIIKALQAAGIEYAKDVPKDEEQLTQIKGIGKKSAEAIMEVLGE